MPQAGLIRRDDGTLQVALQRIENAHATKPSAGDQDAIGLPRLEINSKDIGVIGGGRRNPTGVIDIALILSLVRRGEVSDLVGNYGHLVVDECHHLSAASFELVARRTKARFVPGLSATVTRKDGHHPIIFMQCGPVRYRVGARSHAAENGLTHRAEFRPTGFQLPPGLAASDRPSIASVYAALAQD